MTEPYTLVIRSDAAELRTARQFVGKAFESWGIDPYLGQLVITELVTNTIKHTDVNEMIARVYLADAGPVVEVEDASPVMPVICALTTDSSSGRGLAMIQILAADLGWNACASGGKTVYAVLPGRPDDHF
ncbi:ATP-binding protein [Spirillospora sp. NPDC127200]